MRPGLPRFSRSPASVYYIERKPKNKKRGRPGNEAKFNHCDLFSFPKASESELHLFRLLAHAVHHLPTIVYIDIHDFYKIKQYSIKYNIKNSLSTTKMQKLLSHVTVLKIIRIASYTVAANNSRISGLILQVQ